MEKENYVINKKELMKVISDSYWDAKGEGEEYGAWCIIEKIAQLLNEKPEKFLD